MRPKAIGNDQQTGRPVAVPAVTRPTHQARPKINGMDRFGREIDPAVLAAAEEIGPRALRYGEKLLHDPALAADLLEESAATVSRVSRARGESGSAPVRNLPSYVFRTFVRRVNRARQKDILLCKHGILALECYCHPSSTVDDIEFEVLLREFLSRCDPATRDMFHRRTHGFSWKEIARVHRTSVHAAEAKFSQSLRRVRRKLGLDR